QDVVRLQVAVDDPLFERKLEGAGHVARHAYDVGLGERALALEPRGERVRAQVHREVDVVSGARHEADPDDVRVLELLGGFGFVAEPALELAVAGVARHQDLDGDGGPVQLPTSEHPSEAALPEQTLEVVGADGPAEQVGGGGGCVGHEGFTNPCRRSKLLRSQQLGNWIRCTTRRRRSGSTGCTRETRGPPRSRSRCSPSGSTASPITSGCTPRTSTGSAASSGWSRSAGACSSI